MANNISHSGLCLNIESYDVDELLRLFKLPSINLVTQGHMKDARRIVMSTHPDKSGLDKEYFQFFAKAYERLSDIVDYYNRTSQCPSSYLEKHRKLDVEIDQVENFGHSLKQAGIINGTGKVGKNWNKWKKEFHDWFEKNSELTADNDGYEDFLRSTKDLLPEGATEAEAKAFMEQRRANIRSLVVKQNVDGIDSWNSFGSNQKCGVGSTYGEDIRKAYTETVVPVTNEDFTKRPKYSSLDQYKRARHEEINELDYEEGKKWYYEEEQQKDYQALSKYLSLLNFMEKRKEDVKQFQSTILRLMD